MREGILILSLLGFVHSQVFRWQRQAGEFSQPIFPQQGAIFIPKEQLGPDFDPNRPIAGHFFPNQMAQHVQQSAMARGVPLVQPGLNPMIPLQSIIGMNRPPPQEPIPQATFQQFAGHPFPSGMSIQRGGLEPLETTTVSMPIQERMNPPLPGFQPDRLPPAPLHGMSRHQNSPFNPNSNVTNIQNVQIGLNLELTTNAPSSESSSSSPPITGPIISPDMPPVDKNVDLDGDGAISLPEVQYAAFVHHGLSGSVMEGLFKQVDTNKDNYLDSAEFNEIRTLVLAKAENAAQRYLQSVDLDHNKTLSLSEAQAYILKEYGIGARDVERVWKLVNADVSAELDAVQFSKLRRRIRGMSIRLARQIMKTADSNNDGHISRDEAQAIAFEQEGIGAGDVNQMLLSVDDNGDGELNAPEFADFERIIRARAVDTAKKALKVVDVDGSGTLTMDEARRIAFEHYGFDEKILAPFFAQADENEDGQLDAVEFAGFRSVIRSRAVRNAVDVLKEIDRDGDGFVSRAEAEEKTSREDDMDPAETHALFNIADQNKSGKLDKVELADFLRLVRLSAIKFATDHFKEFDNNRDSVVTLDELVDLIAAKYRVQADVTRAFFEKVDVDQTGDLIPAEIVDFRHEIRKYVSERDTDQIPNEEVNNRFFLTSSTSTQRTTTITPQESSSTPSETVTVEVTTPTSTNAESTSLSTLTTEETTISTTSSTITTSTNRTRPTTSRRPMVFKNPHKMSEDSENLSAIEVAEGDGKAIKETPDDIPAVNEDSVKLIDVAEMDPLEQTKEKKMVAGDEEESLGEDENVPLPQKMGKIPSKTAEKGSSGSTGKKDDGRGPIDVEIQKKKTTTSTRAPLTTSPLVDEIIEYVEVEDDGKGDNKTEEIIEYVEVEEDKDAKKTSNTEKTRESAKKDKERVRDADDKIEKQTTPAKPPGVNDDELELVEEEYEVEDDATTKKST